MKLNVLDMFLAMAERRAKEKRGTLPFMSLKSRH